LRIENWTSQAEAFFRGLVTTIVDVIRDMALA